MKQYLLMCDDNFVNQLKALFNPQSIQFLEVQGLNLNSENKYNLLVSPISLDFVEQTKIADEQVKVGE